MNPGSALRQALQYHRAGNILAAIDAGRQAVAANDPLAARILGLFLAEGGDLTEALQWVCHAVAAGRTAETLTAEGRVRVLMQDWIGAASALHAALTYQPGFAPALRLLQSVQAAGLARRQEAEVLFVAKRFAEAASRFQEAATLYPADTLALYGLGTALHEAGDPAEAIKAYRAALALRPDGIETWHNLGSALQATGDLEGALQAYGRAYVQDSACFARIAQELAAGRTGQVWLNPVALKANLRSSAHDTGLDTRPALPEHPHPPR